MITKKSFMMPLLMLCMFVCGVMYGAVPVSANSRTGQAATEANNTSQGIGGSESVDISVDANGNLTGTTVDGSKGGTIDTGNKFLKTLTMILTLVIAGAVIVLAIIFICHCVSLSKNATNPNGKSSAVSGLIWTVIAVALCGGVAVLMGLFFNIFRK